MGAKYSRSAPNVFQAGARHKRVRNLAECASLANSTSQIGQDRWVLSQTHCKRGGYYLEIGVHDGQRHSNTYILDRDFGWHGTCIDPHMFNMEGRTCTQMRVALGSKPGTAEYSFGGPLSGITSTSTDPEHNAHAKKVSRFRTDMVQVRRPEDVLREAKVPNIIDYLSLDVEGAELDILSVFPFDQYCVRNLSVETNYQIDVAQQIHDLLVANGYTFHRHNQFDDFYTKSCACTDA